MDASVNSPISEPGTEDITALGLDHPGATDAVYRRRRDEIAALARRAAAAEAAPPRLEYTEEEHATWRTVVARLAERQARHASATYLECRSRLAIPEERIPQLADLSRRLSALSGFRLRAVPGLLDSRAFLSSLGERVMCSTQYIRHASRPDYTPEPDVVHEVIGHVPLFAAHDFSELSQRVGRAAEGAGPRQLERLERLYWFTLEFGLVEERGGLRAYGAGLLSSFGELPHAFSAEVERRPFAIEEVVETAYVFSGMQPLLFVIPSLGWLRREIEAFLASPAYTSLG